MRVRLFANSVAAAICEFPSTLFSNEFTAANQESKIRWAMLAPFGDWPNKQGMQRVTKEDAANIVADFEKPSNVLKRKVGIPFYIGHPDHPDFKERYKDTKAYGRIKEMEVRDDGLWAGIKFNGEGEQLIADEAFDGHSVNWFLKADPKNKGVWRPFKVKSAGFTNEPNLPVPPITTANESQQDTIFKRLARLRLFCNQSEGEADVLSDRRTGAMKGAIVKHGTIKSRERFQASKDKAIQASNSATAASATAAANGGKAHEDAKTAHALAADRHIEAGHRAKALGLNEDADGHFSAANGHRTQMDKHIAEMMNGGSDMEFDAANMRYRKLANMRKGKPTANAANEVAMDDIRQQLQSQMASNSKFKKTSPNKNSISGNPWITDLFAPEGDEGWSLVVCLGDDKYYRAGFTLDNGQAKLSDGEPTEVQRSISFKPVKK